ncbi:hmu, partial [Symbiodinium sp. CCMP2456]
ADGDSDDSVSSDAEAAADEGAEPEPARINASPVSPASDSEDEVLASPSAKPEEDVSSDRRDDSDASPAPLEDDEPGDASPAPLEDDEPGPGCLRRGKSTVNLGDLTCQAVLALCKAESSESEASEAEEKKEQPLSPDAAESEEEEMADDDAGVSSGNEDGESIDSQKTLQLGECPPRKKQKKLPAATCSAKEKAVASAEMQRALVEAGRDGVPSRPGKKVADGMKALSTPPCKSKGVHAVDTLTPSPVPMQTAKTARRHVLKKSKAKAKEIKLADRAKGIYGDYNLHDLQIPKAAWPQTNRENKGKHSFTLKSAVGPATIEVLVRTKAFFLKRINEDASGPLGQINFKRFGSVAEAWAAAKQRSGYVEP